MITLNISVSVAVVKLARVRADSTVEDFTLTVHISLVLWAARPSVITVRIVF